MNKRIDLCQTHIFRQQDTVAFNPLLASHTISNPRQQPCLNHAPTAKLTKPECVLNRTTSHPIIIYNAHGAIVPIQALSLALTHITVRILILPSFSEHRLATHIHIAPLWATASASYQHLCILRRDSRPVASLFTAAAHNQFYPGVISQFPVFATCAASFHVPFNTVDPTFLSNGATTIPSSHFAHAHVDTVKRTCLHLRKEDPRRYPCSQTRVTPRVNCQERYTRPPLLKTLESFQALHIALITIRIRVEAHLPTPKSVSLFNLCLMRRVVQLHHPLNM